MENSFEVEYLFEEFLFSEVWNGTITVEFTTLWMELFFFCSLNEYSAGNSRATVQVIELSGANESCN